MNFDKYKFTKYFTTNSETRWANKSEIISECEKLDLATEKYSCAGLPMINDGKTAYVDDKDNHSLIFGSTGSKKSRLFCMPTLRFIIGAGESFVVTDPKGELFERTSGAAKANGYDVVVLNYRDLSRSDSWNPFAVPYNLYHSGDKEAAVSRLNDFINAISEKHEKGSKDIFWINAAKSVALSIVITMLEVCTFEECNLKTFTRFCTEFAKGMTDALSIKLYNLEDSDIIKNNLFDLMQLVPADSIARLNYDGIAGSSDKAKGDVQSMLFTVVGIFLTQEALVRNMSTTSFDIDSIGTKKTAVYLIVPDERTSYHFIATTFIKQCYELLIIKAQENKNRQLPVRVNFVLDEFANIPKVPDMPSMISAARSRNIRFFLVLQSMHQMKEKYGNEAQTIKGNCENWVFLSSKEIDLLDEISSLCGKVSLEAGITVEKQPLISISQLQRLNKQRGEALIFCGRQYPFITEMADIDDCDFATYPCVELTASDNAKMVSIDPKELLNQIMKDERNMPFLDLKMSECEKDDDGNYKERKYKEPDERNYAEYDEDADDGEDYFDSDEEYDDDVNLYDDIDFGDEGDDFEYDSCGNKDDGNDENLRDLLLGKTVNIESNPDMEKAFSENSNNNPSTWDTPVNGLPVPPDIYGNPSEENKLKRNPIYKKIKDKKVVIGGYYDILENDEGDLLIMMGYEGTGNDCTPDNPVLYYDGGNHAIFISRNTQPIICDYIAPGVRNNLIDTREILFAFCSKDDDGETKITAEFNVYVKRFSNISDIADLIMEEQE